MEYHFHTLDNGLKLVHRHTDNIAAHCGIFIDAGSRDESEDENGIAHFIEHTIFKGTGKRRAYHILNRLESVGGDLNAYTTKEETSIYASFLHQHYDRALELMADLITNSVFPEKEITKEKDVIIDEINSYMDTPSEEIFDLFEEYLFEGHPLGRNILGTKEGVRSLNREKIVRFIRNHYYPERMVISSVGSIKWPKLVKLVERYFGDLVHGAVQHERIPVNSSIIFRKEFIKPIHQTHCIVGNAAFGRQDERKYSMFLLNNLLGGPALNSRLNLSIREKHGYSYHVESNYHTYVDTGVFSVYLGTDNGFLEKSLYLLNKELKRLRKSALTGLQLDKLKQQTAGQMALGYESNLNKMLGSGKSLLHDREVLTLNEMHDRINKVTASGILEAANVVFDPASMSELVYKSPEDGL